LKNFEMRFGAPPEVTAAAPGRVNLLGEHTDYNDGYVLPTAIPQKTRVALGRASGSRYKVHSHDLASDVEFGPGQAPEQQFARYIYGCIELIRALVGDVPVLDIYVESEVPMGVGLSSSAALEVATLRALRQLLDVPLDDVALARMAQRAEIEYAGVNCGVLDQMASSLLEPGSMLFLDTRSFERRLLPLPAGAELLVIDSGVQRTLAGSRYNERRAECEVAAGALGLRSLRDATDANAIERLPDPLRRRARHVFSENARVEAGIDASAEEFGRLMSASHQSLRDDYEVSIAPLDTLAALMQAEGDVYGAKLTGAGFGGACVGLCRTGTAAACAERVLRAYTAAGHHGRGLIPAAP
jgi:galactokinase